jgi:cytochrome P450
MQTVTAVPGACPLIGHIPKLLPGALDFLLDCQKYGEMVEIRLGKSKTYLVFDPNLVGDVLVKEQANYVLSSGMKVFQKLAGEGLFTNYTPTWQRQRQLIQPALHQKQVQGYVETIISKTNAVLDSWEQEGINEIDLKSELTQLTLQIILDLLFKTDNSTGQLKSGAEALGGFLEYFSKRMLKMVKFPDFVPTPDNRKAVQNMHTLNQIVKKLIDQKRLQPDNSLLSTLISAKDEDGDGMSDKQLRDEVVTLYAAGHETTAISLVWAIYLILSNPKVLAKVKAELEMVLGGNAPTAHTLRQLTYLDAVLKETLRLYPATWIVSRRTTGERQIGAYTVPAGIDLWVVTYALHRDPKYWDEPEQFKPERWLNSILPHRHKFSYLPFGAGERFCPGRELALTEGLIILAQLLSRFELGLDGEPVGIQLRGTIHPDRVLLARINARIPAATLP